MRMWNCILSFHHSLTFEWYKACVPLFYQACARIGRMAYKGVWHGGGDVGVAADGCRVWQNSSSLSPYMRVQLSLTRSPNVVNCNGCRWRSSPQYCMRANDIYMAHNSKCFNWQLLIIFFFLLFAISVLLFCKHPAKWYVECTKIANENRSYNHHLACHWISVGFTSDFCSFVSDSKTNMTLVIFVFFFCSPILSFSQCHSKLSGHAHALTISSTN